MNRCLCVSVLVVFALAGCVTFILAQGGIAALGIQERQAAQEVVGSLSSGRVDVYQAKKAFKAATTQMRATLVRGALEWAKAYTESAAFKDDYGKQRAQNAPQPLQPKTVEGELAKQRAENRKSIEDSKKSLAEMPENMRAQMAVVIKQMEEQTAKMENDPKMTQIMRQSFEMQIAEDKKQYQAAVADHERRFPADPKVLLAARLRQFLEVSQDVDFSAKLLAEGNKMKFADPRYEAKSENWKLCYRAGKEAVEAARTFAAAWLKQIDAK